MVLVGLRADLGGEQLVEEVGVRDFLLRRLLQTCGKFVLDLVESEPMDLPRFSRGCRAC